MPNQVPRVIYVPWVPLPNQVPRGKVPPNFTELFMFLGCHCQIKSQEVKFHRTLRSCIYVPWVPLQSQVPSSKNPQNFTKLSFIYEVPLPNQAGIVPASPGIVPRIGPMMIGTCLLDQTLPAGHKPI